MTGQDHLVKLRIAANQKIEEKEYWLEKLSGEPASSRFPTDNRHAIAPLVKSYDAVPFELNEALSAGLLKLGAWSDIKLFMILATGLILLIHKYSGGENRDILIGSPVINPGTGVESINSVLVLRNHVDENITFKELLLQVKQTVIEADKHRDYPIEVLMEQLGMSHAGEDAVLFDAAVLLENIQDKKNLENMKPNIIFSFSKTGSRVSGQVEYNSNLYERMTIERISGHFKNSMQSVLAGVDIKVQDIDILLKEEKEKILFEFNDTASDYPRDKTIHELFVAQAAATPDNIAIVEHSEEYVSALPAVPEEFETGAGVRRALPSRSLTYRELDEKSNLAAGIFIKKGVRPGSIVGLLAERSLEIMTGILAVLKAGGAYLSIDPSYPEERKEYMLKDSSTRLLLTTRRPGKGDKQDGREENHKISGWQGETFFIDEVNETTVKVTGHQPSFAAHGPGDLVYIMYTSGSTGSPKGVMVEHRNVVRLVKNTNFISFRRDDRVLQTGALEFDASTFEVWGALLNGLTLYLVSKEKILDPEILKKMIACGKITILWLTSPLFNQVVLSNVETFNGLRNLLVGGDVLSPSHINRVRKRFPRLNVINGYGPTENTTFSTTFLIDKEYKENIPIGKPIANSTTYIVDKSWRLLPIGIFGELWVGGDGVSKGYLNNPELTAENFVEQVTGTSERWENNQKFLRNFFQKATPRRAAGGPTRVGERLAASRHTRENQSQVPLEGARAACYKTGDLARWLPDGNIEFSGRIDQQVKIRGFRIELEEIENRLLKHDLIEEAVILVKKDKKGEKFLYAYIVAKPQVDHFEVKEFLLEELPGYMIPSYFITIEKIPLTANGKVDRRSLPEPELVTAKNEYVLPRDEVEQKLAGIWVDVLGMDNDAVSIDLNFFESGGHSLKAALLLSKLHKVFDINVPLEEIFSNPTIAELAGYIKKAVKDEFIPIEPVEKKQYYAVSSAQKRIYVLQQMDELGIGYNIPSLWHVTGDVEKAKFEQVFYELIRRHESLRTSFHLVNGEPVQRVRNSVAFEIEYYEAGSRQEARGNRKKQESDRFIRPFDLSKAPLMRVGFRESSPGNNYILMVDMHHIISDGTSTNIFVKDFMTLYRGENLPEIRVQYKDFSRWQSGKYHALSIKEQKEYWCREFEAEIPVLNLPADFSRPTVHRFEGSSLEFEMDEKDARALKLYSLTQGTTLFMTLVSIYTILLAKLSGQEDIVVGAPAAGRKHADLESCIGMFINTLTLRNFPTGDKTFEQFLLEVKTRTLEAFANQDYPYENLVEDVAVERDTGRNPLFDVMFALQNFDESGIEIPGLKLDPYHYKTGISKFDLMLQGEEADEGLVFRLEYCTKLFRHESIERFTRYFLGIVSAVLEHPDKPIKEIDLLDGDERKQILIDFNDTRVECPRDKIVSQLFEEQADRTPDHIALVDLEPAEEVRGQENGGSLVKNGLTYGELNRRSNRLVRWLQARGVKPGSIVGIVLERSIEMVLSILGILKAGGSYLPIDPGFPQDRIDYILDDSDAALALSDKQQVREGSSSHLELPAANPGHSTTQADLAYVIYTSGSTGRPKGVLVEQGSVVNLLWILNRHYPLRESDSYLFKTSYMFDVSVTELFGWFLDGGRLVLLEKNGEKNPLVILETIEKQCITHINFVPSMFSHFLDLLSRDNPGRSVTAAGSTGRLYNLKYIFLAGEALLPELVKRFAELRTGVLLENLYGPTEAAVYASKYSLQHWQEQEHVPIGKPLGNMKLYILDQVDRLQPVGVVGELAIAGAGLGRGYLNRPELTAEKFASGGQLFEKSWIKIFHEGQKRRGKPCVPPSLLYRTGDLCRWLPDGNVEFLGRMDHQVKVRGYRIELGEIENLLLQHEHIKQALVLEKKEQGTENYLCAYVVAEIQIEIEELRRYLTASLPGYMIPSHMMMLDDFPLNPSGKVDRQALPVPEIRANKNYKAPRDDMEVRLVKIWSEILGIKSERIGIDDNFFHLGGHSLKATLLVAQIEKRLKTKVPLPEIFRTPRIRGLALYIKNAVEVKFSSIEKVEEKDYYSLTYAQKRLYVLQQMGTEGVAYNMPSVFILEGKTDRDKLKDAFGRLINRHGSLRTSFHMVQGKPVQRVWKSVAFEIEYYEAGNRGEQVIDRFIRPFDLSQAPLLRVGIIDLKRSATAAHDAAIGYSESKNLRSKTRFSPGSCTAETEKMLLVDMHHIISDGTSIGIFIKEFLGLYENEAFPIPVIRYKDFSEWKNRKIANQQEEYWLDRFTGEVPVLDLPVDFTRPVIQSYEGSVMHFEIDKEQSRGLKALAREQGATMFALLLSIYTIFLAKLSGHEDIVVGTPMAGRRHSDLERIIGIFINTLTLRNFPVGRKSFTRFLKEVKEETWKVLENQDYPYERLVERVDVQRDTGRNPLFDTMLVLQNLDIPEVKIKGLSVKPYNIESKISKFDLSLYARESGEKLELSLEYCTKLFKEKTIKRFIDYFKTLLSQSLRCPTMKIEDMEIKSREEKEQILSEFNDTLREYPGDCTIHEQFERQVEETPGRIAVIGRIEGGPPEFSANHFTYCCLNEKSNQLARTLKAKGVKRGTIIGLMVERTVEMMISIFGILKAGGAYLPLDPDYPVERIEYIFVHSGCSVIITNREVDLLQAREYEIIDVGNERLFEGNGENPGKTGKAKDLVYVIYTSGSTGRPKGVMIEHRALSNFIVGMTDVMDFSLNDSILALTTLSFDIFGLETILPLLKGSKVLIGTREEQLNPVSAGKAILNGAVTILQVTPSRLSLLIADQVFRRCLRSLKYLVVGGEAFPAELLNQVHQLRDGIVYNVYGPTETTIWSTIKEVSKGKSLNIGNPIANTLIYILDKYEKLQPVGVSGELCIGGDGLARGYINNPGLTAEKFTPFQPGRRGQMPDSSFIYRTGDVSKWLAGGEIEFLGRMDYQVKIRGFRIELEEIETLLIRHRDIKEAVVINRKAGSGGQTLFAYVVGNGAKVPESTDLREYLSKVLPDYMVPSVFVEVEKIPLTPNGKIDRKKLETLGKRMAASSPFVAPRNLMEKQIIQVWQEVLQLDKVGIHDNYFDLGGTSFEIIQIHSKLKDILKVDFPVVDMFRFTTVFTLTQYLKDDQGAVIRERSGAFEKGRRGKQQRLQKRKEIAL